MIWMRFCLFKRGRKSLEVFSVQRRVFWRKGDDFFLFWNTRNEKNQHFGKKFRKGKIWGKEKWER